MRKKWGGPSDTSSFTYDADGRLASRTDAAGTANFTYLADGLLKTASDPITGLTLTGNYDAAGQLQSITTGTAGSTRSFLYDDLGRLTSHTLGDPANPATATHTISYGYDANSNRTATVVGPATLANGAAYNYTYAYDRADRLISWTDKGTNVTTTYGWDGVGNRVSVGSATATFDQRNRILSDTTGTTYSWTARGTLARTTTAGVVTSYDFDGLGRMTKDNANTSFAYDGLDRLATKTYTPPGNPCVRICTSPTRPGDSPRYTVPPPPVVTTLKYAGDGPEVVSDGKYTYSHWPSGTAMAMTTGTTPRMAGLDGHGDLTYTFNSSGAIVDAASYDPFGSPKAVFPSGGPTVGYQGQWSSEGNVDMNARWYQPGTGTFLSRDQVSVPTGTASDTNRYAYGGANPVTNADPSGQAWQPGYWTKTQTCILVVICWYNDPTWTAPHWTPDWDGQPPWCAYQWVSYFCEAPRPPPDPTPQPPANPPSSPAGGGSPSGGSSGGGGSTGSGSGGVRPSPSPGPQDSNRSPFDPNWPAHTPPYPSGHAPVATGFPAPTPGPGPTPSASVNETVSQSQNPAGGGSPACTTCTQLHGPPAGKPQGGGINWGQQAGEFGKGIGEGLLDLGKGAVGLAKLGGQCVFRGVSGIDLFGCDKTLKAMGSYIVKHPTDVLGQMIDWEDWSHGRYARAAGHVLPSVILTIGTFGVGGAASKGGEAAGLIADAADAGGDFVSVFHGSIHDYSAILNNGLDASRGSTFVSRDAAAARDAIGPNNVQFPGRDPGIIESRIPGSDFQRVLAQHERPYQGFYPYNLDSSEIVLRAQEAFDLFNRYIVR